MKIILLPVLTLLCVQAFAAEKTPLPTAHTSRDIEGWTVRVDDRLLHGDGAALGERALKLLTARLVRSRRRGSPPICCIRLGCSPRSRLAAPR
jgi:hypothetical protein